MALSFAIPENIYVLQALRPMTGAGAAVTSLPISLKLVHKLWVVCNVNTVGTSAAVALVPQTDALVAFGSPAVLTTAVPIWAAVNVAASPVLVRATNAVNYTTVADALFKQVIFEIDPAKLAAGEDCFRISITALAATDFASIDYMIAPRYPSGAPFAPVYTTD